MKIMESVFCKVRNKMDMLKCDNAGMGTVEVVLIIVVLVGLVIIFKDQITEIVNNIFETISSNVESVSS